MNEIKSDIVIIGGGIAGLWCAKELIDNGFSVILIEKANHLATGATTRNEGLIIAGAYHAVAIDDEAEAEKVTKDILEGHAETMAFAPECVEQVGKSYSLIKDEALVELALDRWKRFGVSYKAVSTEVLRDAGIDTRPIRAVFATGEVSINTRKLCHKLASYITNHGGNILVGGEFTPLNSTTARVEINGRMHMLKASKFVVTAGSGTKQIFETLTGKEFPMRFFKSQLLIIPKLSDNNFAYLDAHEATSVVHGNGAIIGYSRDAVEVETPNYDVVLEKDEEIRAALARLFPATRSYGKDAVEVMSIACLKVDIMDSRVPQNNPRVKQGLSIHISEPAENYICALPGKMTEGPSLAREVLSRVLKSKVPIERNDSTLRMASITSVNLRPIDNWLDQNESREPSLI